MKAGFVIAALCLAATPAAAGVMECAARKDCGSLVNQYLWIVVPPGNPNAVEMAAKRGDWTQTIKLRTGVLFVKGLDGDDLRVLLADGRSGWVSTNDAIFLAEADPKKSAALAKAACDRRGEPKIGMTAAELIETCWGKPVRILKRTTAAGVEENYVYSAAHTVKLVDGKVAEIVEAR